MPGQCSEATRWLTPNRRCKSISLSATSARRTDQEAVGQQRGEIMVEIVALRHDLVLTPFAVGVVLGFEIGAGEADRLVAAARDKYFAPHRQFLGKGLAAFVEGPAVDFQLPGQGGQGAVRVDVPAIAEPGRPPDRDIGVGPDPDRRMRLLQWLDR